MWREEGVVCVCVSGDLISYIHYNLSTKTMSKLNASAFEFVPGRGFVAPNLQQPPPQPPQAPIERPEQTDPPRPPPTISLNIGSSKPPPPATTTIQAPPPPPASTTANSTPQSSKPATPKPQTTIKAETAGASSKTFTTGKAKTDTNTVAQDVKNAADQAILEDLYGNRVFIFI